MRSYVNCWKRLKKLFRSEKRSIYNLLNWLKIEPSSEGFIYWHIVNFTPKMQKAAVVRSFVEVIEDWQMALDLIEPKGNFLKIRATKDFDKAHIRIIFVHPYLDYEWIDCTDGKTRRFRIPQRFDGAGGVLAYVPRNTHTIFFDQAENWSDIHSHSGKGISLKDVASHELAHVFDLGHTDEVISVRFPFYNGNDKIITDQDIVDLEVAYSDIKRRFM